MQSRNNLKKGEVFWPFLALSTWLILGAALMAFTSGIKTEDTSLSAASMAVSDANLRASVADINIERIKEYSYCRSVINLAGKGTPNPWSEDSLLKEFEKEFNRTFYGYLTSDQLNYDQPSTGPGGDRPLGYLHKNKQYIFRGKYNTMSDQYTLKASDAENLKIRIAYKGDNARGKTQIGALRFDRLNYWSDNVYVYTNPYSEYEGEHSIDEYKAILDEIKRNLQCINDNTPGKCSFSPGREWKFSKNNDAHDFEVKSGECKPFGNITYKFSINLNTIDETLEHWGDKAAATSGKKRAIEPLFK